MEQGERCLQAERSIQKKYRKSIWNKFVGGLKDYEMIQEGDRIAVCISGGKDSMLLAKCMQLLQRFQASPVRASIPMVLRKTSILNKTQIARIITQQRV